MTTPPGLAPSSLAYLFCDTFTPLAPVGTLGQRCMASGAVVQTTPLAVTLAAMAVVSLRGRGVVDLHQYEKKKLGFTVRGVQARLIAPAPPEGGIEGYLLEYLGSGRKSAEGRDVGDGFLFMIDDKSANPWGVVIRRAMDDVVAHGYVNRSAVNRTLRDMARHKPSATLEPIPERIETARAAFDSFFQYWQQFCTAEPELSAELHRSIGKAIESRRVRTRDDD